jgi:hypothetical protein
MITGSKQKKIGKIQIGNIEQAQYFSNSLIIHEENSKEINI